MYKIPETEEEICRAYRLAKNKREQISILADMTLRTPIEIIEILERGGIECPKKRHRRGGHPTGFENRKDCMIWTAEQEACMLGLWRAGKTRKEIAEIMGLRYPQVLCKLRRMS